MQSTFATRFNRLRRERGHLFQGRYQALLIEDAAALARVVDYIHLNPVRAGIVPAEQIGAFRWSSLRRFTHEGRPAGFECAEWLGQRGCEDSPTGPSGYLEYLTELALDVAEQKRLGLENLSVGGRSGRRRAVAKDHAQQALSPGMAAGELRDLKEAHWTPILEAELKRLGKTKADASEATCSAPWKLSLAACLRREGAPYAWITSELSMGKTSSVRAHLSQLKSSV